MDTNSIDVCATLRLVEATAFRITINLFIIQKDASAAVLDGKHISNEIQKRMRQNSSDTFHCRRSVKEKLSFN